MQLMAVCALTIASSLGLQPKEDVKSDNVDLIEVNHYFDANGKHVFDQMIFFDWCNKSRCYQVRAWRLIKKPNQRPTRSNRKFYQVVWQDGEVIRRVRTKFVRSTWTQYDPEVVERRHRRRNRRPELNSFKKK